MSELREFTRITRKLSVRVHVDGLVVAAHTQNLSLRGALLACSERPRSGTRCVCEIILDENVPDILVRANAHVVRQAHEGIAVCFDELIGAESYSALSQLLLYNAVDPERVARECENHLGLLPSQRPPGGRHEGA